MASSLPVLAVQKLRGSSKVFQGSITGGTCDSVPHWRPQWQNSSPCDLGGCFYRLQNWGSWKAESWKPASRRMRAARGEGMAAREESPGVLESSWPWRSVTLRVHGERLHDRGTLLRSGGTIRVRLYFPTDTKIASYTIICRLRRYFMTYCYMKGPLFKDLYESSSYWLHLSCIFQSIGTLKTLSCKTAFQKCMLCTVKYMCVLCYMLWYVHISMPFMLSWQFTSESQLC